MRHSERDDNAGGHSVLSCSPIEIEPTCLWRRGWNRDDPPFTKPFGWEKLNHGRHLPLHLQWVDSWLSFTLTHMHITYWKYEFLSGVIRSLVLCGHWSVLLECPLCGSLSNRGRRLNNLIYSWSHDLYCYDLQTCICAYLCLCLRSWGWITELAVSQVDVVVMTAGIPRLRRNKCQSEFQVVCVLV